MRAARSSPTSCASTSSGSYAKWQLPDRFEFIDEIPRTATGKFKKTALREQFVGGEGLSPPRSIAALADVAIRGSWNRLRVADAP